MVRAIIIDDEMRSIATLMGMLEMSKHEVVVAGTAMNVVDGLKILNNTVCDILFLDIEMPDGTGFDLLDKLGSITFDVCFITAFNQYAIKAFRYAALDYLMKPIQPEELEQALDKIKRYNNSQGNHRVTFLLENHKAEQPFQKLAVATTEGVFYYELDTIIRCEADGSYTNIIAEKRKPILASKSIKEYEKILPDFFGRVHKSHLVNFNYIKQLSLGEHPQVVLKDNTTVAVSRRRKQMVGDKLAGLL